MTESNKTILEHYENRLQLESKGKKDDLININLNTFVYKYCVRG